MTNRDGRTPVVVGVAAAGLAAVIGVLVAGPVRFEQPRWQPRPTSPAFTPPPQATFAPLPEAGAGAEAVAAVMRIVLYALFAAAVAAVVVAILLYLRRRFADRRRRVHRDRVTGGVVGGDAVLPDTTAAAPAVRHGIARALEILDERREPSDAVVQAWLGLEDAAARSGAPRHPAETPAEHVTRIIGRFAADRPAADMLLGLYQDVRFGGHAADDVTVDAARECLLILQASWHTASATGATGPGQGGGR